MIPTSITTTTISTWCNNFVAWVRGRGDTHRKLFALSGRSSVFVSFAAHEWLSASPFVRDYMFFDVDASVLARWVWGQVGVSKMESFRLSASQDDNWWHNAGGQIRISNMQFGHISVLLQKQAWLDFAQRIVYEVVSRSKSARKPAAGAVCMLGREAIEMLKNLNFSAQDLHEKAYILMRATQEKEPCHDLPC